MQVFAYIRVSGRGQLDDGGPDRQREAIKRFCAQHDLTLAGETVEAVSGTKDSIHRPELRRLLQRCQTSQIHSIVIERLDRLSRELLIQEVLLKELREAKVALYAADGQTLMDCATADQDPGRVAMRQMMGVFAQYEKNIGWMRMWEGRMREYKAKGYCGHMPFGLKNDREKATLEYLLALIASEPTLSYRQVAERMNAKGLKPRNGKPWLGSSIHNTLRTVERRKKLLAED